MIAFSWSRKCVVASAKIVQPAIVEITKPTAFNLESEFDSGSSAAIRSRIENCRFAFLFGMRFARFGDYLPSSYTRKFATATMQVIKIRLKILSD